MELKAVVDNVLEPVTGQGKNGTWKKQSVIVSFMSGKYPNILELVNMKNADEFGKLRVGGEYVFHFDVSSRLYNDKYFTSCMCYKWEATQQAQAPQYAQAPQAPSAPPAYNVPQSAPQNDDLPF